MAGAMGTFDYLSDNGQVYALRLDASNAAVAGAEPATTANGYPRRWRPRYILAAHPTSGRERRITVPDAANPLFTGSIATINLPDFNAAMAATQYIVKGRVGERRYA
jgi:hypothetical protein